MAKKLCISQRASVLLQRSSNLFIIFLILISFGNISPVQAGSNENVISANTETPPLPRLRESWGPEGEATHFQLSSRMKLHSSNGWQIPMAENFEGGFPAGWDLYDLSEDGLDQYWGKDNNFINNGNFSGWVAAGGADAINPAASPCPKGLDTWMISGPYNFSDGVIADLEFSTLYNMAPELDNLFFGASVDGQNFYGSNWSGDSEGWAYYDYDLSEFAGFSNVWIGFYFHSDVTSPDGYRGAWIDDMRLWKWVAPASSETISNGDFETGEMTPWVAEGSTTGVFDTYTHTGKYAAWLGGLDNVDDKLYQHFTIPTWMQAGDIRYWIDLQSTEVEPGYDFFCARIYKMLPTNPLTDPGIIDIGCVDAVNTTNGWKEVVFPLLGNDLDAVRGESIYLYFYLVTDISNFSSAWIDDVTFTVTEKAGDPFEPNNTPQTATNITIGQSYTNLTIDPAQDADWFAFNGLAGEHVFLDVDAANLGSDLDSYLTVYDSNMNMFAWNDDDGISFDSLTDFTVPAEGLYYAVISSYDASGSQFHQYNFSIRTTSQQTFSQQSSVTAEPQEITILPGQSAAAQKEWTFILFLNASKDFMDKDIADWYRTSMEKIIGNKSTFVNVLILVDGPKDRDTERYVVQKDGRYSSITKVNVGEKNMGDGATLVEFANWAIDNYPAQKYLVMVEDHGNGISTSADGSSKIMPSAQVTAFKSISAKIRRKIDIIYYTGCLLGNYETAYNLKDYANYFVVHESMGLSQWAWPWQRIHWFWSGYKPPISRALEKIGPGTSAVDLGKRILDGTAEYINNDAYVLSLIDLSKMETVRTKLDTLSNLLIRNMNSFYATNIVRARNDSQKMNTSMPPEYTLDVNDRFLDLWHFSDRLGAYIPAISSATSELKNAVGQAVIDKRVFSHSSCQKTRCLKYGDARGMSIYFPRTKDNDFSAYPNLFASSQNGKWDDALAKLFSIRPTASSVQLHSDNDVSVLLTDPWWLNFEGMPIDMGMAEPPKVYEGLYGSYLPVITK